MPLHEKRFDPNGTLVVSKANGLRFGGRFYAHGEPISDPVVTLRKLRQLYFQNKLCYDYELTDALAERDAASQAKVEALVERGLAQEKLAREAEQARVAADLAASRAAEQRQSDMAAAVEKANIAAGRIADTAVKLDEVLSGRASTEQQPVVAEESAPRRRRARRDGDNSEPAVASAPAAPELTPPEVSALVVDGLGSIE